MNFLVINGPNLNLLGTREPEVYGPDTLESIKKYTETKLEGKANITWYQSNIEGEIVTVIQESLNKNYDALIINPAAYTHTSVAILDALKLIKIPIVEVHLSNTNAREDFRKTKLTSSVAKSIMEGFGKETYYLAIYSQIHKYKE